MRLSLTGGRSHIVQLLVFPHTHYWSRDTHRPTTEQGVRRDQDKSTGTKDAYTMLRQVLGLDILRSKLPYPPP